MDVVKICEEAKLGSYKIAVAETQVKNRVLLTLKEKLLKNIPTILAQNAVDVAKAEVSGKSQTFLDRLSLSEERIFGITKGLDDIVALADPVGEITEGYSVKSGLSIRKIRAPLGVIGIIFEARPNVSVDAAALCIKSGNAVVLRGSRDSVNSVRVLTNYIREALQECGLPAEICAVVEGEDRELTALMLRQTSSIDVVIPRGGEGLKKVVLENAKMPVVASAGGNCHMYIAKSANVDMVIKLVVNAKTQRAGVCNALETLLFDKSWDKDGSKTKQVLKALCAKGVEIRGTKEINKIFPVLVVDSDEFYKEYEDLIIKVKYVNDFADAVEHINKHSTSHSDGIITEDRSEGERFLRAVDSAAVYVNASTRFTDGFEFGLGAEMGISTQKLHVRGPIGLKELTSVKYIIRGEGTERG
jgi:glutamate-5-semialdehyde dehydrogenase